MLLVLGGGHSHSHDDHLHVHSGHSHAHSLEDLSVGLSVLGKFFDMIVLNFILHFVKFVCSVYVKHIEMVLLHGKKKIGNI